MSESVFYCFLFYSFLLFLHFYSAVQINFRTGGTLSEALGEYEYNLLRLRSKMFFVDNQVQFDLRLSISQLTLCLFMTWHRSACSPPCMPKRGKELAVTVCNTTHALPVSDPTGHIEGHISIQRSALLSCTAPGFEISAERIKVCDAVNVLRIIYSDESRVMNVRYVCGRCPSFTPRTSAVSSKAP